MTRGHRHRTVTVRYKGLLHRVLTMTLFTVGTEQAEKSRLVYGQTDSPDRWRLSPLGLLHGLTGLTLDVRGGEGW